MIVPQYYNEFDPYAAQWLRNLIAAGHLPPGDVDERSIVDIQPEDLNGYGQCHFFAGIGVWPYALGRNDWRERDSLWSGSCPCQPFSAAGQQLGFDDERHLWPAWFHLITQRRPAIVVGEQVSSALAWLDLVRDDLESAGYAVGAADLCAPGFPVENWEQSAQHEWLLRAIYDCPDPLVAAELLDFASFANGNLGAHDGDHIRQRLYFVGMADAEDGHGWGGISGTEKGTWPREFGRGRPAGGSADSRMAEPDGRQRDGQPSGEGCERNGPSTGWYESDGRPQSGGAVSRLGEPDDPRLAGPISAERGQFGPVGQTAVRGAIGGVADGSGDGRREECTDSRGGRERDSAEGRAAGFGAGGNACGTDAIDRRGSAADWLYCRDGKWRAVGPGAFPLANAPAARVGRLRAYGNALDAETVVAFLAAVRECAP